MTWAFASMKANIAGGVDDQSTGRVDRPAVGRI